MKENIQYDYSKLKGKIVEKFGNIKNFSNYITLSTTALYKKLSSKEYFNQRQIDMIKNALGLKENEISKYFFKQKVKKNLTKEME